MKRMRKRRGRSVSFPINDSELLPTVHRVQLRHPGSHRTSKTQSNQIKTQEAEAEAKAEEEMMMEWSEWDSIPASESKSGGGSAASAGGCVDARERHKLAERERRKSMRELFLSLHALLPHANTVRKEQSAILDEIIKYIPLAAARLRSLKSRRELPPGQPPHDSTRSGTAPAVQVSERSSPSSNSSNFDIRVAPEPSSSVAIRVRGDRVNVSLTDTKGTSQALLLSAVLDELEAHHLDLVRSTHCRDGNKLLHHSESKISDGLDRSPALLKERLQDLASKLHKLRKSSSLKRTFDQMD